MMNRRNLLFSCSLIGVILGVSACGGSNDNNETTQTTSTIAVIPALGVVTNAAVKLYQSDTTTLLATSDTGADGVININYTSSYSGPIMIAVLGDDVDAQYYDEATRSNVPFGAGKQLRALVPAGTTQSAVTTLTETAYQLSVANGIALTNTTVNQLNERVRLALAPELSSILTPPTTFDADTTTGSLDNSQAGMHALRLAALAQLGASNATPALKVSEQLAWDMADGVVDGANNNDPILNLVYNPSTLNSKLATHLSNLAGLFGTAALRQGISSYGSISTTINVADLVNAGGGNGSASTNCNTACQQFFADNGGTSLNFIPDLTLLKAALSSEFDGAASYSVNIGSNGTLIVTGDETQFTFSESEISQFEVAAHETNVIYEDGESNYKVIFQKQGGNLMINIHEPWTQGADLNSLANATLDYTPAE